MSAATNLFPFRVTLLEEPGDKSHQLFDCLAETADHAEEQAENAYPGAQIITVIPFDDSPLAYVIYSANESTISDGAGFWNSEDGWADFSSASLFSHAEIQKLSLPMSSENDAKWMLWSEANIRYGIKQQGTASVRLTLDVSYQLNGCTPEDMAEFLRRMCEYAIGDGMLTGGAAAEVSDYSMAVAIQSEALSEDDLANFMLDRIENGDLDLEDIPVRLARYGLMDPVAFVGEMQERMAELSQEN